MDIGIGEHYLAVIENPVLGIAWGTMDGRLIDCNDAFCRMLGSSKEELKGAHFKDFTHPDDLEKATGLFRKLVRGEIDNYQIEKRYISKNRTVDWVKVNVTASRNASEHGSSIVAIVQDISERKQAEEELLKSEANLRFLLDNTDMACVLLDTSLNVLAANRLANEWAKSEMNVSLETGKNFMTNFPEIFKDRANEILQKVLQGATHQYEAPYTRHDKVSGWYNVKVAAIVDEKRNVVGVCVAANDVTARKKTEAEVRAMNNLLEKKVKERTAELENANRELEAFTYSVSHDLMAPLRIIDGFSQVLLDDNKNKLDEDGLQTIHVIRRNATRMGELVNDLLNIARLGRASLVKRPIDMNELVTQVIDEMRFTTNKLAAKIKLKELGHAECDPVLLKQVWMNLLSNAVKYSGTRANPMIEIGAAEKNGQVVYYIKDNGVGFDMQYVGKLFGVFQRLHKAAEFPGTGVGLAIVHRIVVRHGGKVWADAKVNEGAVFYFTLP